MIRALTRKVLGTAAAAVDRVATAAVSAHGARSSGVLRPRPESERLTRLIELASDGSAASLERFFPPVGRIVPGARQVRRERSGLEVFDVSWASSYEAHAAGRYTETSANATAVCRLHRRGQPRAVAILIHGYMAGHFALEARLWPLSAFDSAGYDTALFTLPFHGLRTPPGASRVPAFPGSDPRFNIEGFRHAIWDLRNLTAWLREQGHPRVGAIGMSLGGYTAALLATVEPELDFVVPVVPLASLADWAREQGSLNAAADPAQGEHALLEAIYRPVSPLSRPSLVPPSRALVIAARSDRITPVTHARRLAQHLRAPLHAFYGGHLLQLGRGAAFRELQEFLLRTTPAPA
jgi:pimeloyl-ACP methyl ester carboxylesterase